MQRQLRDHPRTPFPQLARLAGKLEDRIQNLVAIIKSMKPKPAARILQGWDIELAAMILMRLPARVASKVVAAMPPGEAGKLTAKLAPDEQ